MLCRQPIQRLFASKSVCETYIENNTLSNSNCNMNSIYCHQPATYLSSLSLRNRLIVELIVSPFVACPRRVSTFEFPFDISPLLRQRICLFRFSRIENVRDDIYIHLC
jgi:hypothetical protein